MTTSTPTNAYTPERRSWLHSLGFTDAIIHHYSLDRPMSDLAWSVLVKEVVRYAGTMRKGSVQRKHKLETQSQPQSQGENHEP